MPNWKPWSREELAARVARDIPEGWYVNLGIGIPTLIGNYVPPDREVIFHSENGIIGMGPAPNPEALNPWLVNASRQHVTLVTGASYLNHADSFGVARAAGISIFAYSAGSRWPKTAIWPTGRDRTTTARRRSAERWTSRSAPSASGW